MDRATLEQYRDILSEIADLSDRLQLLRRAERVTDTVKGSDPHWPHHKRIFKIEGVPERRDAAVCSLESLYMGEVQRLNALRLEIEDWIREIPDSRDRQIFRMYCIDGLLFSEIAARLCMSESSVRYRRYDRVLRERGVK